METSSVTTSRLAVLPTMQRGLDGVVAARAGAGGCKLPLVADTVMISAFQFCEVLPLSLLSPLLFFEGD